MDISRDPLVHSYRSSDTTFSMSDTFRPGIDRRHVSVSYSRDLDQSSVRSSHRADSYGSTTRRRERQTTEEVSSLMQTDKTEQIALSWMDLKAAVPEKKSFFTRRIQPEKEILKGVSGYVLPGTLLAIMGPGSSGKTTLLNVLTHRNIEGLKVSGDVSANGEPIGTNIRTISGYVQQEDRFVGILTLREHLWFQAMLRMEGNMTDYERECRVDDVIHELGLGKCQNTVIGVAGRVKAISGGERKRVAFAAEILKKPPLIFCDEPTSGLDSFMAENVVQTLRGMARSGKTILCTIQQPSSQVFALFDNVLLLADGRVGYLGPATGAGEFFEQAGYPCPEHFNPADFYVKTLSADPAEEDASHPRVPSICDGFERSPQNRKIKDKISQISAVMENVVVSPTAFDVAGLSDYKAGLLRQFKHVMWRSWVVAARNRLLLFLQVFQFFILALFIGLLCSGQQNNQKAVQNINGVIFHLITACTYGYVMTVVHAFPNEIHVFKRDLDNGMYRPLIYYCCKLLADVPLFLLIPVIYSTTLYFLSGFRPEVGPYFIYLATSIYLTHISLSYVYAISIMTSDVATALSIAMPTGAPFTLLCGYFVNDATIPVYFAWLNYINWTRYSMEIYVINQWHNFGNLTCEYSQENNNTAGPNLSTSLGNSTASSTSCYGTGDEVVASLNFNPDNLVPNFLIITALFLVLRVFGYISLLFRVRNIKRKSYW